MPNSRNRDFDKYAFAGLLISTICLFAMFREALTALVPPTTSLTGRFWGSAMGFVALIELSAWQLRDRSIAWSVPTCALALACIWSGVNILIIRGVHQPSMIVLILGSAYTVIGLVLTYTLRHIHNDFFVHDGDA
jgi:hypothetical protein